MLQFICQLYFFRTTIYTPKVIDDTKSQKVHDAHECLRQYQQQQEDKTKSIEDVNNNSKELPKTDNVPDIISSSSKSEDHSDEEQTIIPWRAHLRKTNSKLNLLE